MRWLDSMAKKRRILDCARPMLFDDDPPPKLVGIARLAASSDLLEAKRQVEYLELETRRFIGRGSGRMRSIWTINPYRGCEYGCKYCYARYAHEFMELRDPELFERKIYAKQFQALAFRAEVRRLKSGDTIWIGTATDPYQPAERRFQITRQMLEVFAGRARTGLRHHHQVRFRRARRCAHGSNRPEKQDSRAPHHHHARRAVGPADRAARAASRAAFGRGQEADRCRSSGQRSGASRDAADQRQRREPGSGLRRRRPQRSIVLQRRSRCS